MTDNSATNAVLLAQAQQRLDQEHEVFLRMLERDRALGRLQLAMGWMVFAMLPAVAAVCVVIMVNHRTVPQEMLTTAYGVLFVDILGLVVATWKTLVPQNSEGNLDPVTADPVLRG